MRRTLGAGAAVGILAITVAGCNSPTPLRPADPSTPREGGDLSISGCTPAGRLVPGDAVDPCGVRIMDAVNDRLIRYRDEGAAPEPNLASEITSSDGQTFTVHLEHGRTFHDGTEIKAHNFVKAWNWNAAGEHGYAGASYFAAIQGADAMACRSAAPDASPDRTTTPAKGTCRKGAQPTELSGLHEVDDYTFTVALTRPIPGFADRLGHPVYAPYPDSFFTAGQTPDPQQRSADVGSGPFRIESVQSGQIVLRRAENYPAQRRPHVDRVTVRTDTGRAGGVDDAYADVVGGRMDFTNVVPTDNLVDDQWKSQLKDRWRQGPVPQMETLTFATTDQQLREPEIRRAISRAIDRQALTRKVFNDTRVPAQGWVPTGVGDDQTVACGQLCDTDAKAARRAFEAAGGYTGQFLVTVNGDGGNKQWADSLCNQLRVNLGLDCQVRVVSTHADIARMLAQGQLTGVYRQDWAAAYASPGAYLDAYATGAYAGGGYRNSAFEGQLAKAEAARTPQEATPAYRAAQEALVADPPSIPLWSGGNPVGWSSRVHEVSLTAQGWLDLSTAWVG